MFSILSLHFFIGKLQGKPLKHKGAAPRILGGSISGHWPLPLHRQPLSILSLLGRTSQALGPVTPSAQPLTLSSPYNLHRLEVSNSPAEPSVCCAGD